MIQIDYSLLLQIVNFVALIFILNFILYRPLLNVIDKRKLIIEQGQAEIDRLEQSVAEKIAVYEQKVQATRLEALVKNKDVIKGATEQAKVILAEAGSKMAAITEEFHINIQKEALAARQILSERSRQLSLDIAEKVLGRRLQ
ncbi:MAG: ATP synthase F0 subunit B [Syntrophales bacterium]